MIAKQTQFLYNNLMTRNITLLTALLTLVLPSTALAYMEPEDVLLNRELFLPPSSRDAQERTAIQTQESAARREREQERAFELQNPTPEPEPVEEESLHGAAPTMQQQGGGYIYAVPINSDGTAAFPQQVFGAAPAANTQAANLELARTMRLLSRVNQNQATNQFNQQVLHSGADDLAPTGAGSVLAALTMIGAVLYTLRRAKRSEAMAQAF